ncbi:MAG: alpha/beta hydrolase [Pseudomonadota bacterium]
MPSRTHSILLTLMLCAAAGNALANPPMTSEVRHFNVDGNRLVGLYSTPTDRAATATVIIVHGYGPTNVIEHNWYYDLRYRLASAGFSSFVWDKPGSGQSEGEFDIDQPVASSAEEVLAARAFLQHNDLPGSGSIGLYSSSRGGWIAPIAMSKDPALAFWISASGVDDKETFGYLLETNWRLDGYAETRISLLLSQWKAGNAIVADGGGYKDFLAATPDYRADPFVLELVGGDDSFSNVSYDAYQSSWQAASSGLDPETGLMIYVENFDSLLSSLDVPVLALFGEKDSSVDWRSTRRLYETTIGANPSASLTVKTFPNGNHNLHKSETGSFKEMLELSNRPQMVDGYFETILAWLQSQR